MNITWPWTRPTVTPEPVETPPPPAPAYPLLVGVFVEPVRFEGETLKHRLIMRFNTGDIVLGEATDAAKLEALAADIRDELGIDV